MSRLLHRREWAPTHRVVRPRLEAGAGATARASMLHGAAIECSSVRISVSVRPAIPTHSVRSPSRHEALQNRKVAHAALAARSARVYRTESPHGTVSGAGGHK